MEQHMIRKLIEDMFINMQKNSFDQFVEIFGIISDNNATVFDDWDDVVEYASDHNAQFARIAKRGGYRERDTGADISAGETIGVDEDDDFFVYFTERKLWKSFTKNEFYKIYLTKMVDWAIDHPEEFEDEFAELGIDSESSQFQAMQKQ